MPWICARTHSRKEKYALEQLRQRAGLEVYAPRLRTRRRTASGKVPALQFLFPGYLFVNCENPEQPHLVEYTPGILKVVRRAHEPICVDADIIAKLRETYPQDQPYEIPDPALQPGARVEIIAGSLKSLKATVLAHLPAHQRIRILVEFLGRENRVDLPENFAMALKPDHDD